jgi:methyl-accepting chemotaxis protein
MEDKGKARTSKMKKILNSLQTKLILSFILLIVVVAGGTFIFTFGQTKKALLDITRDDMLQIIGMASTQFTGNEIQQISQFTVGQDDTPEFLAIKKKLQEMRALSPNIVNYYIMRIEGKKVTFLMDDLADDPAKIDDPYDDPDIRLFDATQNLSVSDDVYTDEWGTFLSGYAPVKNASGETVFVLGADMLATKVMERQNFIGGTIYWIMGVGILLAALIIGIFSVTIIRDIKKLNAAAEKISMGDTNIRVDVKRNDEIGELAESFERMVASLKIMMAGDEPQDGDEQASKSQ